MKAREHGTNSGYAGGCRCEPCKEAHAADQRERYRRRHEADVAEAFRLISCIIANEPAADLFAASPATTVKRLKAADQGVIEAVKALHWRQWLRSDRAKTGCKCYRGVLPEKLLR